MTPAPVSFRYVYAEPPGESPEWRCTPATLRRACQTMAETAGTWSRRVILVRDTTGRVHRLTPPKTRRS